MVTYDRDDVNRSGLCNIIVDEAIEILDEIWTIQYMDGVEAEVAFSLDGDDLTISDSMSGHDGYMDRETTENLLEQIGMGGQRGGLDAAGTIHTHPSNSFLSMSMLDLTSHFRMCLEYEKYDTSMALTRDEDDMVLFGIRSTHSREALIEASRKMDGFYEDYESLDEMDEKIEVLEEAVRVAFGVSNSCERFFPPTYLSSMGSDVYDGMDITELD